jgi:ubiquinone/menaquinone biosynthesis C-methylase UbiE
MNRGIEQWDITLAFYIKLGFPWQWLKDAYLPVIVEIKNTVGDLKGKRILDHGCGSGKITKLFKKFYESDVSGIDPSEDMIDKAKKNDPTGTYELLKENGKFPWENSTFDAVMSNWVFVNIGSTKEMTTATKEIYRVLKPEGVFVMLVNNPSYIGKRTTTYQNGEPNRRYKPGEEITVKYFREIDGVFEFNNCYWPIDTYHSVMKKVGFGVRQYVPTLNLKTKKEIKFLQSKGAFPDVNYQALIKEKPTLILVGKKLA